MHRLLCFALLFLFFIPNALAESDPAIVLNEMLAKIKSTQDPAAIIEYVHWESAYRDLDENQKRVFEVKSPEELSAYYRRLLNNPNAIITEQLEKHLAELPADKQAMLKERLLQISQQASSEFRARKNRFLEADYQVGKSSVSGDTAEVEMISKTSGGEKKESINFIKVDGKWFLPSIDKVNKSAASK